MMQMNTTYHALLPAIGMILGRAVRAVSLLIPVLLLAGAVEAQTTHIVTTTRNNPWDDGAHFWPPRLTIPVGDRVEWRIPGGHTLTWPAGEFPPFPTSSPFTYSHTFDSPGTFGYRCTAHTKSGSITVVGETVPTAPFQINAGLNDAWKNPDTPGQGFFITVFPETGQIFLAWFTYDTERPADSATASIGEPGHRWLTAFGHYADNQAILDVEITQGGTFNSANPTPTQHLDGTVILEFGSCTAGTLTYNIVSANLQGEIPIQRIAPDNVPLCQQIAEQLQQSRINSERD